MTPTPIPHPITSEAQITAILKKDSWRMQVLRAAEQLDLPDWWIGAGFLRNPIWDTMEGKPIEQPRDIDLVYFNPDDTAPEADWAYDQQMNARFPDAEWGIRNQARMHYVNGFTPYTSTADGIAHWVETATCVVVKLQNGELKYLFCHGTHDLFHLIARPTLAFQTPSLLPTFYERLEKKRWRQKWPHLSVEDK